MLFAETHPSDLPKYYVAAVQQRLDHCEIHQTGATEPMAEEKVFGSIFGRFGFDENGVNGFVVGSWNIVDLVREVEISEYLLLHLMDESSVCGLGFFFYLCVHRDILI